MRSEPGPGPTGEPYPSGSRPAGPDAESMDPDQGGRSSQPTRTGDLPSALARIREIRARLGSASAVFIHFDSVLAPLLEERVSRDEVRKAMQGLSTAVPVVVITHGAAEDAARGVGVDGLNYVGDNGLDVSAGEATSRQQAVEALNRAERHLAAGMRDLEGVRIERSPGTITLHTAEATSATARTQAEALAAQVAEQLAGVVVTRGVGVSQLRATVTADRGSAVVDLLAALGGRRSAVYVGGPDDDEVFAAVRAAGGITIVVGRGLDVEQVTQAEFRVEVLADTIDFLSEMTRLLARDSSS